MCSLLYGFGKKGLFMETRNREGLILIYACEFGLSLYKGTKYIRLILKHYMENGDFESAAGCKRAVSAAAKEAGIDTGNLKRGVLYSLRKNWAYGSAAAWKHYTGWEGAELPDKDAAIRLLCENYPAFEEKYKNGARIPSPWG